MDQHATNDSNTSSSDTVIDGVKLTSSVSSGPDKAKTRKSTHSERSYNNKSLKSPFVAQSEIMDKILKHFENPETLESKESKPDVFFSKRITERLVSTIGKRSKKSIELANSNSNNTKNNSNEVNSNSNSGTVTTEESKSDVHRLIRNNKMPPIYAMKTYSRNKLTAQNNIEIPSESQKVAKVIESNQSATLNNNDANEKLPQVVSPAIERDEKAGTLNGKEVSEASVAIGEATDDNNGVRINSLKSKETNEQRREIVIKSLMGQSRAGKRELKNLLQDEGAIDMIYSVNCRQQMSNKTEDVIHSSSLTPTSDSDQKVSRVNVIQQLSSHNDETLIAKKKRGSKKVKIEDRIVAANEKSVTDDDDDDDSSNKDAVLIVVPQAETTDPPTQIETIVAPVSDSSFDRALYRTNSRFNHHLHKSKIIRTYSDCSDSDFEINDDVDKNSGDLIVVHELTSSSASHEHHADELSAQIYAGYEEHFHYDSFIVKRFQNFVEIVLKTTIQIVQNGLTCQIMDDLSDCLEKLKTDTECKLVLWTSAGKVFCHGIDFISLIADSKVERLALAIKMATAFERFVNALVDFPKLLIAGIDGSVKGCAVTLLPLFDLVFASDQVTFSTPYNTLACLPENISLFRDKIPSSIVKELFYCGRELNASEALSCGLITRKLLHQNFKHDLLLIVKGISCQSLTIIETTKSIMNNNSTILNGAFKNELKLLVDSWVSDDCQNRFKGVLVTNKF